MKKAIFIVLTVVLALQLQAQTQNLDCLGWKNPTSFTFTGGSGNTQWSGWTGSKTATASSIGNIPWLSSATAVAAGDLSTITGGTSNGEQNNQTSSLSKDQNGNPDSEKRFVIKKYEGTEAIGVGSDPENGGRLKYTPYDEDTSITRSIRLGNYRGNANAEALTYQISVNENNALLTLWFALSLQNGQHSAAENPEFVIMIERQLTNGTWQLLGQENGTQNKYGYVRPTPAGSGTNVAPFYVGYHSNTLPATEQQTGATYGCNLYLPWTKVVIDLSNYMYSTIRITMAAGDCSQSAHYANAYIAGDCQTYLLTSSGCAAGSNNYVTTLNAPKGMLTYQWYKSAIGPMNPAQRQDANNWVSVSNASTDPSVLQVTTDHLTYGGQIHDENDIKCVMTSLMNLNDPTATITGETFVSVSNTKPTLGYDVIPSCGNEVKFVNLSEGHCVSVSDLNRINKDSTIWEVFDTPVAPAEGGSPVATLTGDSATYTFSAAGEHSVRMTAFTYTTDTTTGFLNCYTTNKVDHITSYSSPVGAIQLSRNNLCSGDSIDITDVTTNSIYHRWRFKNDFGMDTTLPVWTTSMRTIGFRFEHTTVVELTTHTNQYFMKDTNFDGVTERVYCNTTVYDTVYVEDYPVLQVSGDTIVCNGNESVVKVNVTNAAGGATYTYDWYKNDTLGAPYQANMQTLTTHEAHTPTQYYVLVTSPNGCRAWDSIFVGIVNPHQFYRTNYGIAEICPGDVATLWADSAARFKWYADPYDATLDGQSESDTIRVSPEQTTMYKLVGYGTKAFGEECAADTLYQQIVVRPYPILGYQLTPPYIDSQNPSVQFSDTSEYGTSTLWMFGDGNTSTARTVVYTFTDLGKDSVLITMVGYNSLGCADTTTFWVPISPFAVWFPNAFTPRLESNNVFKPVTGNALNDYELAIYDRGGALVFYTNDQEEGWDGKHEGVECKQGAYVYIVKYRRPGVNRQMSAKGTVMLLR